MWLSCACHTMSPFLQPTEEDKVLKEKVMGSCKQVGALKCLTEIFHVLFYPLIFHFSSNLPFSCKASEAYLQGNNGQALYYYEEAIRIAEQNKGVRSYRHHRCHNYHSLAKERPWTEHLTNLPKGWALFWVFPHLTSDECPCHVYSDSMPSKQIIGQTLT